MNTALFLEKQIMDVINDNNSQDGDHQNHHVGDNGLESKKESIFPSYDFQPIRPNASVGLSRSALDLAGSVNSTAARAWAASDPKPVSTSSAILSYGSMDSLEPSKLFVDKDQNAPESTIISAIDRIMKTHADNLLHVMEGVSARLTQLETRTRNLENLVDDVKVSVGNSHGNTDGKMRHLENILLEVQSGVQLLKDKQEIFEAQLQLSKLQVSNVNQPSEKHSTHVEPTAQPPASQPQPPASAAPPSSFTQQGLPPPQFIQPPASQHNLPRPSSQLSQLPSQFSPQQEPYFPPPGQSQPPPAHQPPPPHPTHSLYQPPYQSPPQQPQYSQQPPTRIQQPSSSYNPEEPPYPMQSYPPNPSLQPPSHPPSSSAPSQQYYNSPPTPPSVYDASGGRFSSGFPSGYSPEPYPYTGPYSSNFGNTPIEKPPHQSGSGSGGYPQLPMARPVAQGLPMAAAISSGGSGSSGSPRSGSRVPVDGVINKVVSMGFPRDQVRGTVRKLTENGQAVDLNVVLDKLMNGDRGALMQQQQQQQPPRGWFGGR